MVVSTPEQAGFSRPDLAGRRVLVLGLGRTGQAVVRFASTAGADVCWADASPSVAVPRDLASFERLSGQDPEVLLSGIDLVVPSPGVPATSPVLAEAVRRNIPVVSEIELAAQHLDAPMVAVTGTNGKSTTTELIASMLEGSYGRVFAGGNLGTPLIEAVSEGCDVAVVEVSSFQLEWVDTFRPKAAVHLNLTADHLDRHGDVDTYAAVKARIFARQSPADVAILNRDDLRVAGLALGLGASVATFGTGTRAGDGAELRDDAVHAGLRGRRGAYGLERFRLLGTHNRENVMAAVLAAMAMDASDESIQAGIDGFEALAHRMQEVHTHGGVRFVDDSKGTNLGALERSIDGLPDGRVVLVAGGKDKGTDFAPARELVGRKARTVVLYGSARKAIADAWEGVAPLVTHEKFDDAVRAASVAAESGDVVLLSPACASFDQFENYAKRGDAFASIVRSLA